MSQGSILLVTLVYLKVRKSLAQVLKSEIQGKAYMLTTLIFVTNQKYVNAIECQLQLFLHRIESWADENGFRFSKTRTTCVHFCSQLKLHDDP